MIPRRGAPGLTGRGLSGRCLAGRGLAGTLFLLAAVLLAGCGDEAPPAAEPPAEIPAPAPVGVNEVAAIAVHGGRAWLATSAGVVSFVPGSGAWILHAEGPGLSHHGARAVAVAADGTAWTAHAGEPEDDALPAGAAAPRTGPRGGGVRAFRPDGSVGAYFAEHGLPSDDAWCVAAPTGLIAAGTSKGLALLRDGATAFEAAESAPKRKLVVVDAVRGGPARNLTEFRPRDERVTALAAWGGMLWIGTSHGLLAQHDAAAYRYRMPACRRDGHAADHVVALGAWEGGVAATVGLQRGDDVEPSGLVEIAVAGSARCHAAGVDVPAALSPAVATDGRTTWVATYEGLLRVRGDELLLFERGRELPATPPTAVAIDAEGTAWVGFWGGGIARITDAGVTIWRFGTGREGVAAPQALAPAPP